MFGTAARSAISGMCYAMTGQEQLGASCLPRRRDAARGASTRRNSRYDGMFAVDYFWMLCQDGCESCEQLRAGLSIKIIAFTKPGAPAAFIADFQGAQ
jgi:hypothetical protein